MHCVDKIIIALQLVDTRRSTLCTHSLSSTQTYHKVYRLYMYIEVGGREYMYMTGACSEMHTLAGIHAAL